VRPGAAHWRTRRARRLSRFAGVGLAGFIVQALVIWALGLAGIGPALATAAAVEAAIVHNFVWHERWTWRDRRRDERSLPARLLRYHAATGAIALAGNVAITSALVRFGLLPVVLANAVAVATLSGLGFVVADRWVFRPHDDSAAGDAGCGARRARRSRAAA
jgi:putative flippase GtrA